MNKPDGILENASFKSRIIVEPWKIRTGESAWIINF